MLDRRRLECEPTESLSAFEFTDEPAADPVIEGLLNTLLCVVDWVADDALDVAGGDGEGACIG